MMVKKSINNDVSINQFSSSYLYFGLLLLILQNIKITELSILK